MNLAFGKGEALEQVLVFFLTLMAEHPIASILSFVASISATYGITKFVAADVKRRNEKLGVKPLETSGDLWLPIIFFALLLWGLCGLFIWLGSLLIDYLDF